MPSDAKKKQQQKKKEAAKARQAGRKVAGSNKTENGLTEKEQSPAPDQPEMNGSGENGTDFSTEGRLVNILLGGSLSGTISKLGLSVVLIITNNMLWKQFPSSGEKMVKYLLI
jgi:hypothetical protein